MEDARIHELDVKVDGRNYSIFGVFDGHGGKTLLMQGPKYRNSLRTTLLKS